VLAIMEKTTLSRKSFYVHFRDRSELIVALVRPLRAQADESLAQWAGAADPVGAGRAALRAAASLYPAATARSCARCSGHQPKTPTWPWPGASSPSRSSTPR